MTEAEWHVCTDPTPMVEFLDQRASDRKLLQFGCACCRRVWHLLTDHRSRACIEITERLLDGQASGEEEARARKVFDEAALAGETEDYRGLDSHELIRNLVCYVGAHAAWDVSRIAAEGVAHWAARSVAHPSDDGFTESWRAAEAAEYIVHCDLLRDIFGNPFCPVALDPSWLAWNDGAVRKMAQAIYDERAFDRLPLLADALEDAGCADAAILGHCRGGEHVRGCWVIDLLLGKE